MVPRRTDLISVPARARLNQTRYVQRSRATSRRTFIAGLSLVSQLELLLTVVSIGALTSFFMLHISVIVHFAWRGRSRQYIRHLAVPVVGAAIIAYVLVSAEIHAKIVGLTWMILGLVIMLALKLTGRLPALPGPAESVASG